VIDIIIFTIALAALAYTLLPYIYHGRADTAVDLAAEDLFIAKERIYANIKDLDFDHQVGKVADADYHLMRNHMKEEAGQILEQIDHLHGGASRGALEREIAQHRATKVGACGQCGEALAAGARFCPQCGQATT